MIISLLLKGIIFAQIANLKIIANYSSSISIDILAESYYNTDESQDAVATFAEIVDYIEIVKK